MIGVRYSCRRCGNEVEAAEWPDTKLPRCWECARAEQEWADREHLATELRLNEAKPVDERMPEALAATMRLLLNVVWALNRMPKAQA